jgi:energy-coupling factor transport system ATP-binding protein
VTGPAGGASADPASAARHPAIELTGVTFEYEGGHRALDAVDLRVERGEFVAVMGPNGAGKTTLCLMLNGVIPNVIGGSLAGTVTIDGLATTEHHVYELAERVGVVLQDPDAQILATNLVSEVAFAAENLGVPRDEMRGRIARALAIVRLTGLDDRAPEELSGGQKQRLAIAAGLVMDPPIFVLDEPTAQLDPIGAAEVFDVLVRLNRESGATIVIATHDSEDAARCASRVVVLDRGRIIADGPPQDVFGQVDLLDRAGIGVAEVVRIQLGLEGASRTSELALDVPGAARRLEADLAAGRLSIVSSDPARARGEVPVTTAEPQLEIRGLTYRYLPGSPAALSDVSLTIRPGEFLALIGQNGSGKTTLVKCLSGLVRPEAGEVLVDGRPLTQRGARDLPRRVGVVLQNPDTQLFRMSVVDEIRFGLENIGVPRDEQGPRISAALELTGLEAVADVYPFKLSFGDRRKVAVAAIVAMRPEILVFDEPTTGQDYRGRYQLCEIAAELNSRGTTVIMITHDMDLVARYTWRAVVLGLGRVLFDGSTREAFSRPELLRETFLAPPQAAQLAQALSGRGVRPDLLSVTEVLAALRPGVDVSAAGTVTPR